MVKRIVMLMVGGLALVACGPGAKIDGKQGAAEAMFAASQPSKASNAASPIDVSARCAHGGTAEIHGAGISIGTGSVATSFNMKYSDCGMAKSDVGIAIFNGELTFSQSVMTSGGNANLSQGFKGKLLVQGAYDDFLDVDVTQQVAVGDLGANGTGVSVVLKGTIKTSEGTFTYDEAVSVVAGKISAKIQASR